MGWFKRLKEGITTSTKEKKETIVMAPTFNPEFFCVHLKLKIISDSFNL